MAKKEELRDIRSGMVVNSTSKRQEKSLGKAVARVIKYIEEKFSGLKLKHDRQWKLHIVVSELRKTYPNIDFTYFFDTSSMRPDGGIVSIVSKSGKNLPILISEKKIKVLTI